MSCITKLAPSGNARADESAYAEDDLITALFVEGRVIFVQMNLHNTLDRFATIASRAGQTTEWHRSQSESLRSPLARHGTRLFPLGPTPRLIR
jgi:hypothetical protein